MKKERVKNLQKALLVVFSLQSIVCQASEPQKVKKEAPTCTMRMKIGEEPWVEEEYFSPYLKFDKLLTIVKQALEVIKAKDNAARDQAKKKLAELMTDEKLDQLIKKVVGKDVATIQGSADKVSLEKAYEHLCDIVLAIDSQKEFVVKELSPAYTLSHAKDELVHEPVQSEANKSGVHYFAFPPAIQKAEVVKKPMSKPQAFDLTTIVNQAERVVKAKNDKAREDAQAKLDLLMLDKRIHPAIRKVIDVDIDNMLNAPDAQARIKAYDRLRDMIELINSLKFVAINEAIGYGESAYRKLTGAVKRVVPGFVQNIADISVEYLVGKDPLAKSNFYKNLTLMASGYATGKGIRAMLNKYKILTYMPEWEKKVEEATALRTEAVKGATEVYAQGGNPWEDNAWYALNDKLEKAEDEANELVHMLHRAGVPRDILGAITKKYWEIYVPSEPEVPTGK